MVTIPEDAPLIKYKVQNYNIERLNDYIDGVGSFVSNKGEMFTWAVSPQGSTYWMNAGSYDSLPEEGKSYLQWLLKNHDKMELSDPDGTKWDQEETEEEEEFMDWGLDDDQGEGDDW